MTKVGGPGGGTPQQTQSKGPEPKANEQDAGQFRQAVDKGRSKPNERKDSGRDKGMDDGKTEKKSSSRGDSMLKSLQSQSGEGQQAQMPPNPAITDKGSGGGQQTQMTDMAGRADSISDIAKSVADSIQVGAKGTAGEGEVRIQLKDSVLDGAEVRVKQEGGRFEITFVTKTADSQNFLANRLGDFRGELGNRLDREVNINIQTQEDMDRQDSQDRRSRQQYVADDDDQG